MVCSILNAQKISIYCSDYNIGKRYRSCGEVGCHISEDYFISSFSSESFYEDVEQWTNKTSEVSLSFIQDSIGLKDYENSCRLVFTDTLTDTLSFYMGEYLKFRGSFYKLDCEFYTYYIGFVPLAHALYTTPNAIWKLDCPLAEDLRKYADFRKLKH